MINELNNLKTQVCKLNAPTAVSEDTWNQFTANTTVALMAGGESSRFKSVPGSEHSNKSSFRLPNGDTMIEMAVRMYRDAGFKKFVCLVYHKAESVKEVLGNGSALGVEVLYSHDPEQAVGKGGAVLNAILNGSIDPTKPLIIHNPDDVILNSTKEFPRHISTGYLNGVEAGADITLVVVEETPYAYTGMVVTDNKITACTPIIEAKHSNGNGLLSDNGASRGNLFSGDAADNVLTHSQLSKLGKIYTPSYYAFFSYPYSYIRLVVLMIQDMWFEFVSQRRQIKHNVMPRLIEHRKGFYYIIRAFMTVLLKEINTFTIIGDIYKGEANAVYASYVGYDELAHHSGVMDVDAFKHLTEIDKDLNKLYTAGQEAPRKYDIVVISDHGQSWGQTFKQRYNYTLEQLIQGNIEDGAAVSAVLNNDEGVMNLKLLLDDIGKDDSSFISKIIKPFRKRAEKEVEKVEIDTKADDKVLIYASGNLGLIYFPESKERLTKEEIDEIYPLLLENLVKHEGIGFVMVNTKNEGPVVIAKDGKHYLESGKVEGSDPLKTYRKLAKQHLLREHNFHNCPDVLINSTFDPITGEVAAFEELIGNHGGLGGYQSRPFVLHPTKFTAPSEKIVGAEQLHKVLKNWTL